MSESLTKKYVLIVLYFCYCTSEEGTHHRQGGYCTCSQIFPIYANKAYEVLIKKKIHITSYYFISGTRERNYNICVVITNNTTAKMFSIVTFCILARGFNGKLSYLFSSG